MRDISTLVVRYVVFQVGAMHKALGNYGDGSLEKTLEEIVAGFAGFGVLIWAGLEMNLVSFAPRLVLFGALIAVYLAGGIAQWLRP